MRQGHGLIQHKGLCGVVAKIVVANYTQYVKLSACIACPFGYFVKGCVEMLVFILCVEVVYVVQYSQAVGGRCGIVQQSVQAVGFCRRGGKGDYLYCKQNRKQACRYFFQWSYSRCVDV